MAAALAGGVLTIGTAPVSAIPTTHEIKANWAGSPAPTSVLLGAVVNAEWHINTNDANTPPLNADVSNVTLTVTATNGKFASLPSSCKKTGVTPVSSLSADGITMVCNLGTVKEGTATVVQTPMRATDINGGKISATGTVTSGSAVAPATAGLPPLQITYSNGLDVNIQYAPIRNYQGNQVLENGVLRTQMRINFSVILKNGSRPGPANYNFPLTISSTTPGARLTGITFEECRTVGWPSQGHPWSGTQADRTNFPGCAVTGTNLSYTVRLSNLDYTLTRVPVNDSLGKPLPTGYGTYIASGSIVFSIPGEPPVTTNYAFNINPPNVTFPAAGTAPAQTLAENPKTNNASSVTLYVPGEFSNRWAGTPTASRDAWDDQLLLTPGTSVGVPLPAPDGIPSGDQLPLYSQANSNAWNAYTGGNTTAGVCTMRQQDPQSGHMFTYDKADFFAHDGAYKNMTTARLWVYTGAINTKTFTCGPSNTGWTQVFGPGNYTGKHAGDPRENNTYLTDIPNNTNAIRVTWNPAIDKATYVAVRGFGFIRANAPFTTSGNWVEGWTVGSYNRPGEATWRNQSNTTNGTTPTPSATATPWSSYAVGTNGWRDPFRVIGYEGFIKKVASDTSAPPGVPVTYTITAQAQTAATSALPTTITVTDTIPAGMVYVPNSSTPAPLSVSGQTITWRFTNVPVNTDRVITYQAMVPLGSTRPPGTQLTNNAVITVPGDIRPVDERTAKATVVIPNNGATILGKSATDNVLSFYGDTSSWKLVLNSFDPSSNAYTDTIDVLPYNGDPNGTDIDGAYTITTVQAPAGSKIYYSTADPATINKDARHASNGGPNTIVGNTVGWTTTKPAKPTAIRVIGPALAPGTVQTITINFTTPAGTNCVTPAATDNKPGEKLVNVAGSYAGHTALPMLSSAQTVIGDCYALDLVKSVLRKGGDPAVESDWHDADSVADYQQYANGDSPQYRIVVTNKGTGTLANVAVVDDKYPAACNTTIAELLPGASQTINCTGVVNYGTTVNTATATADPADGPNLTASDPAGVVVPELFDVRKVSEPPAGSNVNAGDVIKYTITVTEPATSPAPYGNPSLTDNLADVLDSAAYNDDVFADYGMATIVDGVLDWSAPVIMPGQTVTITYSVTVQPLGPDDGDGDLVNAVVGGTCPDPAITDPTNAAFDPDCSSTLLVPSYTVGKSADPATGSVVEPGDEVTYTVVVTNTGPTTADASVSDDLTAVLDDAVYNGDASAGLGNPVPLVSGNTLSWSKTLAVGEVVTLTYSVTIKPSTSLGDGKLDNVVTATGPTTSCLAGEQAPDCRTHQDVAAVRYEKVISDPDVLNIEDGQEFTYTITAKNVGNTPLTGLTYVDDLSEVLDDANYVVGSETASIGTLTPDIPNEQMLWEGDLAVGETATMTYRVIVDNSLPNGDNVLFNAIVGTGPGSNCVADPVRPECVTQVPKPLLESRKVITVPAPPETVDAGDTVTYQVTVKNIGAELARSIPILDDMSDALDAAVYNDDATAISDVVGNTPPTPTYQAPQLLWTGDIAVNETITITYTMTVNGIEELGDDGTLTNFLITPDCPSPPILDPQAPGYDPDCVTITPIPGYIIEKSSAPVEGSVIRAGTPVTYTLRLRNTGGVDLTPNIVDDLSDILDDATYVPGSATASAGSPPSVDETPGAEELAWLGPLPVGGTVTLTYQVQVQAAPDLANGKLHNTVFGDGPTNCLDPVVTDPTAPGYDPRCVNEILVESYVQSKDSVAVPIRPSGNVQPGDRVDYKVTIRNTGAVALNPTIFDDMTAVMDDADLVTTGVNAPASTSGDAPVFDPTTNRFTWTGLLAVGQAIDLTYSVIIKDTGALGDGVLDNVTTGTGPTTCPTDNPPAECKTRELVESVKFKKVITNPNVLELQPGDSFTYTVTAENTGAVALTAATNNQASFEDDLTKVLDDADIIEASITQTTGDANYVPAAPPLPPLLTWSGDLAIGETATITYTVTIKDPLPTPPLADGVLINAVAGEGPGANCQPPIITDPGAPDYDPDCTTRVPQPLLDTVKEIVSPAVPKAGDTVTYRITTTNTGVGPALGIDVIDDLTDVIDDGTYMEDAHIVSGGGTLAPYDATAHTLTWTGDIPPAGSMVIEYTVQVKTLAEMADADDTGDGVLVNSVTGPGCPNPPILDPTAEGFDDECVIITPIPGYTIVKSSVPPEGSDVLPGSQVDYTLTIKNVGGVPLNETITDDLVGVTDDATYIVGSSAVAGVTASPDLVSVNTLTWTGPIPLGATVLITYSVTVDDAADLGDAELGNVVGGTGPTNCPVPPITDPTAAGYDERCINVIRVKAYTLVKSSAPESGTAVKPGDVVTYTLTIVNTGSVPVTPDVTDDLSDVLDDAEYTEFNEENPDPEAPAPARPDFDADAQTIHWSQEIQPGDIVEVKYQVTIKGVDPSTGRLPGNGILDNVVTTPGEESPCPPAGVKPPGEGCRTVQPVKAVRYEKSIDEPDVLEIQPGDTFTYTVEAINIGQAPLSGPTDLRFVDDLSQVLDDADLVLASITQSTGTTTPNVAGQTLTWEGGTVAVGDRATITYDVTVKDPIPGDAILLNVITGTGPGSNCVDPVQGPECDTVVPQPKLESKKTVIQPSTAEPGGTITYQITVKNIGEGPALLVPVLDDMSDALGAADYNDDAVADIDDAPTWSSPTLSWRGNIAAGATVTITYSMTVHQVDNLDDAVLTNVLITPDCPNPPVTDPQDERYDLDCITVTPIPGYVINKSSEVESGNDPLVPGDVVHYTVTATNVGALPLSETITDDLSKVLDDATGPTDVSASSGMTPTVQGQSLVWTGDIAVDQVITIEYTMTVKDLDELGDGVLDNNVTGTGETNCPTGAPTEDCIEVHPVKAWDVIKTADSDVVVPGSTVTYTIVARNVGGVDLTGLTYDDNMGSVLDDAMYNNDATATVGATSYTAPTLTWTGDLAIGQEAVVTYTMTVNKPFSGDKQMTNVVTTDEEGPCPPNSGDPECTVDLPGRSLLIAKDTVPADIAPVAPGETVHYRFTVTNTGVLAYLPATVVDSLADALDAAGLPTDITVTGPGTASLDAGAKTLTWTGPLQPGETATIDYDMLVTTPMSGDGRLENVVSSPDPGNNCPTDLLNSNGGLALAFGDMPPDCKTTTPIRAQQVVKTSDPGNGAALSVGQMITYTVTIANTGQAALTPATFTDDLSSVLDDATLEGTPVASSGNVSYGAPVISWSGDLALGAQATVTYTLRIKAGGDGQLRNTVVSNGPDSNCPDGSGDTDCTTSASVLATPPPPAPPATVPDPGELPATGGNSTNLLQIVLLLGLSGAVLVLISRRRRRATS